MNEFLATVLVLIGYIVGCVTTYVLFRSAPKDGELHFIKDNTHKVVDLYCVFKEQPLDLSKKKYLTFEVKEDKPRE